MEAVTRVNRVTSIGFRCTDLPAGRSRRFATGAPRPLRASLRRKVQRFGFHGEKKSRTFQHLPDPDSAGMRRDTCEIS